jgi:menaquinone-specific isochorismate synthase
VTQHDQIDSLSIMLRRQPEHIWIDSTRALLGWGNATTVDVGSGPERYERAMAALEAADGTRAFASFTFDPDEPGSVVVLPESVVEVTDGVARVLSGEPPEPGPWRQIPALVRIDDDDTGWAGGFARAMRSLELAEVDKVVLSRAVTARLGGEPPLEVIAANLARDQQDSAVFVVDHLVGSSPELLASLDGDQVRSVCLAGSAPLGDRSSLEVDKALREHEFAADSVADALEPHCISLARSPRHRADFAQISHLATTFEGRVRPGTRVLDMVRDLHPTAAVAGTPGKAALELIREIEGRQRGRYAGPVGWFDSDGNGSFAIALRCGLVRGNAIVLHAGAGLVVGSDEMAEYAETELKLRPMLGGLGLG